MKKTNLDKFEPRRDGLYEHQGTWGEVTVGTIIADPSYRSKRWEVIATSHGAPGSHLRFGYTLWFRVREVTSGEEYTIQPHPIPAKVTLLTPDPEDTQTPPMTEPSDADAIMLLVKELGAELLAERDDETGIISCPDYTSRSHLPGRHRWGNLTRGLTEHMNICHGMSVPGEGLELAELITLHGRAHSGRYPDIGKGGFPHKHSPEVDVSFM